MKSSGESSCTNDDDNNSPKCENNQGELASEYCLVGPALDAGNMGM